MQITKQRHGEVAVIKPDGPLVGADADQFQTSVLTAVGVHLGRCVIDLSAVPFSDSKGLEALLNVSDEISAGGQVLKLCAVNKTLRQVLELTGLISHFEYFDDVNSAVRSLL